MFEKPPSWKRDAVFNICESGDHFISSSSIYGGTFNLFGTTMKKMGIECTFLRKMGWIKDGDLKLD